MPLACFKRCSFKKNLGERFRISLFNARRAPVQGCAPNFGCKAKNVRYQTAHWLRQPPNRHAHDSQDRSGRSMPTTETVHEYLSVLFPSFTARFVDLDTWPSICVSIRDWASGERTIRMRALFTSSKAADGRWEGRSRTEQNRTEQNR